jgi:hypothetical protein
MMLAKDVTVEQVLQTLLHPERYLVGMLGNMMLAKREYGDACVRIGITGAGKAPHYRVEPGESYMDATLATITDDDKKDDDLARYFVAYLGQGHKRLPWGKEQLLGSDNWSTSRTTISEVQVILGRLRGFIPGG